MCQVQRAFTAVTTLALLISSRAGAADVASGPAKAAMIPGSFSMLVVNGKWKDVNDKLVERPHSVVVEFGLRPVVLVFARSTDEATFAFLKKLDSRIEAHKEVFLKGGAALLCYDNKRAKGEIEAKELLALAKEKEEILAQVKDKAQGLKNVVVGMTAPDGPTDWKLNKKADITVVFYDKFIVKQARGFEKGDLDDKATTELLKVLDAFVGEIRKRPANK